MALWLLHEMTAEQLDPNTITYSAGISACEKGGEWQLALALLRKIPGASLEPDTISYNAGALATGRGTSVEHVLLGGGARHRRVQRRLLRLRKSRVVERGVGPDARAASHCFACWHDQLQCC